MECNSVFLGDLWIPDVQDRRKFCHKKIRSRYGSYLKKIMYGAEDLQEFGPQLRYAICEQMEMHEIVMSRLRWPVSPTFDADAWSHAWEMEKDYDYKDAPEWLKNEYLVDDSLAASLASG